MEQVFQMTVSDDRITERVIADENLHYAHIVLPKGETVPEHYSNATTFMAVLRGTLTIGLADQKPHEYPCGTLIKIPLNVKMSIQNTHDMVLEFTIVKAPAPKS